MVFLHLFLMQTLCSGIPVQRLMQRKTLECLTYLPCEESGAFLINHMNCGTFFNVHGPGHRHFILCFAFAGALLCLLAQDGPGPAPLLMVR